MNKKILNLALPFLIGNISIPLLGLVDTAILGHLESEVYLGAIALGGMVFNFLFWGFSFLKMGTTGFVSQAYGRKEDVSIFFKRGFFIAVLISLLIIVFQKFIWQFAFLFMEGSDEVNKLSYQYYHIRIYSAPAVFLLYVVIGWFLGMQNAVYVLYITLFENILNVIFNLVFVFYFGMRVNGVALGTVFAQYLALILALGLLFYKYKNTFKKHSLNTILNFKSFVQNMKVNSDIMIRTIALMFAFAFFTVKSSSVNDLLLATNMILLQFLTFFSYVVDGFAHAGESLAGYFYGARKNKALKLLIKKLIVFGMILSLIFSLAYLIGFDFFINILTNQVDIFKETHKYKWWLVILPLFSFMAYLWDGIYIGLTATSFLRNTMVLSFVIIYIPIYYVFFPYLGNDALWLAMTLFMISRGLFLTIFSRKIIIINKFY